MKAGTELLRRSISDPSSWNNNHEFHRSETDPMLEAAADDTKTSAATIDEELGMQQQRTDRGTEKKSTMSTKNTSNSSDESPESDDNNDAVQGGNHHLGWARGLGRGIIADYKRTIGTHWKSEMINFDLKTVAVSFFLFFACIAPAITFGAIYEKVTHNWIGAVEMITATAWCGIAYALIGGQPMMINGGTGPVLAFTEILYSMSVSIGVPFLTFNAWIGIWVCIYMCIAALVNLNRIMKYATRFTDEIFAFLIATIFIINALGSPFAPVGVLYYFNPNHKSHDKYEDDPNYSYIASALLSLLLCLGTVWASFTLRKIKFSPFFPNQTLRNIITDFSVVIAIFAMTLIANLAFSDTPTETLNVPNTFEPTFSCCTEACDTNWPDDCPDQSAPYGQRPWLVNLGNLNGHNWIPFMAAGPALLAFILVFLDDGITWHLINNPTHKLTHGEAYNYDTLIIGIMIAINSLLGLPWLVAATVRSLNHVHAMAEKTADGKIISVKETRLTHLFIHLLCLASLFALDVLKLIPVPVLYGVFLFMGLVSLGTNQFWGRILMFFMQPSKYPIEPYTVHMKPRRMHLYTLIQLGLFILLYVVKAIKTIAIAFPLIIALCIPIRLYLLPRIFTEEELVMIDSDDETVKAWLMTHQESAQPLLDDKSSDEEAQEPQREDGDEEAVPPEEGLVGEDRDGVFIPPPVGGPRGPHHHDARKKAISCPPGMFFTEEIEAVEKRDQPTPLRTTQVKKHRTRKKTVSCPPHMLFAEADEEGDQMAPLSAQVKKHPKRHKAVSVPPGHTFFAEVPYSATSIGLSRVEEEAEEETSEEMAAQSFGGDFSTDRTHRRRRVKTVSCPPHMLFAEAERQVNSNYFFG